VIRIVQAMLALLAFVWLAFGLFMAITLFAHPAVGKEKRAMTRQISAAGLEHIKHFEGCRLTSYYCVAARCTIGYGHAGPEVKPGMKITQERAEELLRQDLRHAEQAVAELVKVPLTDGQHAALVDFVFNLGREAFAQSTLLKLLNKRQYAEAGEQLMRWVHSGGQIIAGLQRRRLAAREMWFSGH
jgi:lysozyme